METPINLRETRSLLRKRGNFLFTMREMNRQNRLLRQGLVTAGIGAVLAIIGPFGTFLDLTLAERLAYWLGIMVVNWLQITAALWAIERLSVDRNIAWPLQTAAACVLAAVPATFEVFWLEATFRPDALGYLPSWGQIYVYVVVLSLAITLPLFALDRRRRSVGANTPTDTASQSEPAFLRRIPAALGRELLCLATEDHYLRVHTSIGNDLILHRLRDALAELEGADGLQVHRGYWVARAAVADVERDGRKTVLVLVNGLRVPVSRSYQSQLKAAGWLQPERRAGPGP